MNFGQSSLGVVALVAHARDVHSEERERFAQAAAAIEHDPRVIMLRTCHRVELYVAASPSGDEAVARPPLELPELPVGGRQLENDEAAHHLFAVAAGLDSVVLGEDQILHQLRECVTERHLPSFEDSGEDCADGHRPALTPPQPGELEPVLDRLFQLALHVGRQTRAWREGPPRSLADIALDRIETTDSLAGRTVLVVGAGQMSRLSALAAARRGARVVITNRSADRAAHLAADVAGGTVAFGALPPDVAGVIIAISGLWELSGSAARDLIDGHEIVVDLSSPPAVAETIREGLGARFVSDDDIARGPVDVLRPRLRNRIERLIDEAGAELARWVGGRAGVPTIQALTEQAEIRRAAEVDRLLRRMPELADHERELVDQMSRRLVAGLLHAPLASLRDDQNGEHDRAARDLFSL